MKAIPKEKVFQETKQRIRALLKNITESDCRQDGVVFNDGHSIHFTLRNNDYHLKGTITKRVI